VSAAQGGRGVGESPARAADASPAGAPERPRVLVVGQGPPTAGGIPTFIGGLLRSAWLRERVEFTPLNTTPPGEKEPGGLTLANLRWAVVHAWAIVRASRNVDVVHLNLAPAPTLPLARAALLAAAARAGRARVILHAHTGRLPLSAERAAYRALLRIVGRLVDVLVVVSRDAERAARSCGVDVVYVPNGVDPTEFAAGPKPGGPPVILFLGTVCERKGLLDLRDALRSLVDGGALGRDDVRVQIVGDSRQEGPDAYRKVRDAYARSGLEWVEFVGAVDRASVCRLLAAASIFCLPSHWEAFPLSLLEAMASACAVIASDVGDISMILGDGEAGVVVSPRDPRSLAEAVGALVHDDRERGRLGRAARRRVEAEFSEAALAARMYALYRS
jgi:glycosyltransferase involved in cell wall biosynthesis